MTIFRTVSERIFLGRQPIFDRVRNVIGYELLYRDSMSNAANFELRLSGATGTVYWGKIAIWV